MPDIRPVRTEDVPAVVALIGEIFAEYGCTLDAENEDTHLLTPGEHFRARGGEFWVVEDAGRIVATAAVQVAPPVAELKCLYVAREYRREGWGAMLSRMCMEYARQAGARRMDLWSDTRFTAAHALYESLGFRREGTRNLHDSNNTTEFGFSTAL